MAKKIVKEEKGGGIREAYMDAAFKSTHDFESHCWENDWTDAVYGMYASALEFIKSPFKKKAKVSSKIFNTLVLAPLGILYSLIVTASIIAPLTMLYAYASYKKEARKYNKRQKSSNKVNKKIPSIKKRNEIKDVSKKLNKDNKKSINKRSK